MGELRMLVSLTVRNLAVFLFGVFLMPSHTQANQKTPDYGIFYQRYEPTFYTGFAPRTQDPARIHIQIGRGNQVRMTAVLSENTLETYARDLAVRYRTYKSLIEENTLELTQNAGFEDFDRTISRISIEKLVREEAGGSAQKLRSQNLALMKTLNPGRVFDIRMPVDAVIGKWLGELVKRDFKKPKERRQLDIINAMLSTRLHFAELQPATKTELKNLLAKVKRANVKNRPALIEDIRSDYLALLNGLTASRYTVIGESFAFTEFTAIFPIGSFNGYTTYKGQKIPLYPTPGRRALTTHQRSKTVDHIPDKTEYSYSPWIPYMHVGKKLHNSFHTLWWKMDPSKVSFLPPELSIAPKSERSGKKYKYLWLLSRGPMSHGCTHVNTGHIGEMRQLMPAETKRLYEIDVFLNKSYQFDVFDIDGDLAPEVMGVKYFYAYALKNNVPAGQRVPAERQAFYNWLYGGALKMNAKGKGYFELAEDGRFLKRKPAKGKLYKNIPLYEAEFEPQRLQFYKHKGIPFTRELRKVGTNYSASF
jgi:hypothetical protein